MITIVKLKKNDTLYEWNDTLNSGKDEILELAKRESSEWGMTTNQVSRMMLGFDTTSDNYNQVNLRMFASNIEGLKAQTITVGTYVLSQAWSEGEGKYFDNPVNNSTAGASWKYKTVSTQATWSAAVVSGIASASQYSVGGATWFTGSNSGSVSTQKDVEASNLYDSQFYDLNINITNLWGHFTASNITNNGIILKHVTETGTDVLGSIKYFSRHTNTIYYPRIVLKYDDSTWSGSSGTGSATNYGTNLKVMGTNQSTIYYLGNSGKYDKNATIRFRPVVRETFPTSSYSTASIADTVKTFSSGSAFYSIVDVKTDEEIIQLDETYTKLSADDTSMYFDIKMSSLERGRIYKPVLKVNSRTFTGSVEYFDNKDHFEVVA